MKILIFSLLAFLPTALSYSCRACEHYEGCKTIQLGKVKWDSEKFEWNVIEECGCRYECEPGYSATKVPVVSVDETILPPATPSPPSPPTTPPPPCNEQFEYHITMLQCSEDPERPGTWVVISSDPYNCQGQCIRSTPTYPPTPPSTPSNDPTCDQQTRTYYSYLVAVCEQNLDNPGIWINTNPDPYNCEGYCNSTFPSPPIPCGEQVYTAFWYDMHQCGERQPAPGQGPDVWITTNSDPNNCTGYCKEGIIATPPPDDPLPCSQQLYTPFWYAMMQCGEDPSNPGVWITTNPDPYNCEGYCKHTSVPTTKKKKCFPVTSVNVE